MWTRIGRVLRRSDAALIAAAPEALRHLLDVADDARALLDDTGVEDLCSGALTEYGCPGCPAHNLARAALARWEGTS